MKTAIYHLHALTALHAGTGQGVGVIDLPVARERSTGLPIVPGSGIKGVLREELRPDDGEDKTQWEALFGPDSDSAERDDARRFAGALAIQDAQLLSLPVRSIHGVFAWLSCPFVLRRYLRDRARSSLSPAPGKLAQPADENIAISGNSCLARDAKVYLEDLDLEAVEDMDSGPMASLIADSVFPGDPEWRDLFIERFAIVSDAVFDYLAETATEVRARIRLKPDTRTVAKGGLWYEENLPAETLLWGLLGCDRARNGTQSADELLDTFRRDLETDGETRLQIGGKATVGRGNVRWLLNTGD